MSISQLEMICWCGVHYQARTADVNRGWGLSCSKSHAAIRRDFGKPKAVRADGVKVPRVRKKDRGANRYTIDKRKYLKIDDNIGHIFESGYFGHGQS